MDEVDKGRINLNLRNLVDCTHYDALVSAIAKQNRKDIIPDSLLNKWKTRRSFGWSTSQLNSELYSEFQRRGPQAFALLTSCLLTSGHENLACILDPTLSIQQESDVEEPNANVSRHLEYYSEEGTPFVFIDQSWESEECQKDREILHNFFYQLGYKHCEINTEIDDVASLIIVNFDNFSTDGLQREKLWVNEIFNKRFLLMKPKIMLSFRYKGVKKNHKVTEQDSGQIQTWFRDILLVKIYVDHSKRRTETHSEEVRHLIRVFGMDEPVSFVDKVQMLSNEFKKYGMSLDKQDVGFAKQYRLKKSAQV